MDVLCKKWEIEKAIGILDDMISKGLQPNVITYSILINGHCKKREIDKAMLLSKENEPRVPSTSPPTSMWFGQWPLMPQNKF
jgi:pentatricopeptide repeat protein